MQITASELQRAGS